MDAGEVGTRSQEFKAIYSRVYREPPYEEGDEQAEDFVQQLADQRERPGFSLVVAEAADGSLVGFAYGLTFSPDRWWRHAGEEPHLTRGRAKFALREFVVLPEWRGAGLGGALMSAVLSNRSEPYATLCANPAALARRIYRSWGWQQVGSSHPPHIGPMDVLVKQLAARTVAETSRNTVPADSRNPS